MDRKCFALSLAYFFFNKQLNSQTLNLISMIIVAVQGKSSAWFHVMQYQSQRRGQCCINEYHYLLFGPCSWALLNFTYLMQRRELMPSLVEQWCCQFWTRAFPHNHQIGLLFIISTETTSIDYLPVAPSAFTQLTSFPFLSLFMSIFDSGFFYSFNGF